MLSLQACRDLLGPSAGALTDAQLEDLRERYYQLARALIGSYRDSRRPADAEPRLRLCDQPRPLRRPRMVRRTA
jgi:hypothetical protein